MRDSEDRQRNGFVFAKKRLPIRQHLVSSRKQILDTSNGVKKNMFRPCKRTGSLRYHLSASNAKRPQSLTSFALALKQANGQEKKEE